MAGRTHTCMLSAAAPPLPEDDPIPPPLPPSPPPSTHTSNPHAERLDFDSGDGGNMQQIVLGNARGEARVSQFGLYCPAELCEPPSKKRRVVPSLEQDDDDDDDDKSVDDGSEICQDVNTACSSDLEEGEIAETTSTGTMSVSTNNQIIDLHVGTEFDIIDDVGSENDDELSEMGLDSEDDYLDEEEIDALLESGIDSYKIHQQQQNGSGSAGSENEDDYAAPIEKEKIVLKERGHDPFEILPEGWVTVTHNSGMPVYLHKQSRVCTLSKPYFLGPGSARKHDIPLSAVPCLQYRRQLEKEHQDMTDELCKNSVNHNGIKEDGDLTDGNNSLSEDGQIASSQDDILSLTKSDDIDGHTDLSNPHNLPVPTVKIHSAAEKRKESSLDPLEVRNYCEGLFEFKTITVKRFKTWKDRRKHHRQVKKSSCPTLPANTKLITCPIPVGSQDDKPKRKKEFVLNPLGKSDVCILHEYVQHAMRVQPKYVFKELEYAQTPYSATVVINDVEYGTGYASSKRVAKNEAAKNTLKILIPEMYKMENEERGSSDLADLSFFDEVKIEDPRVFELCSKAGQASPFHILYECLKRNYGLGDTHLKMDMKTLKHQKSEFTMSVGKHEAKVICKNKREGKQLAAQAILQLLHPHIQSWGSILRLYGRGWKTIKEKKEEEQSITVLQAKAKHKRPNNAILNKLHEEMVRLKSKREAIKSHSRGRLQLDGIALPSSVPSVDL